MTYRRFIAINLALYIVLHEAGACWSRPKVFETDSELHAKSMLLNGLEPVTTDKPHELTIPAEHLSEPPVRCSYPWLQIMVQFLVISTVGKTKLDCLGAEGRALVRVGEESPSGYAD
jgi:hypothetical protein